MRLETDLSKLENEISQALTQLELLHQQMKITKEQMEAVRAMLAANKDKMRSVSVVQQEIDKLMPMIEKAREAIKAMGPEQLNEIASYKNPPDRVRMVLEAITLILTGKKLTWDLIKKEMTNDFVERILKINWSKIKHTVLNTLKTDFFDNPQWDIAKINRASQAIGPLADWMMGQKKILDVMKTEDPNKGELKELYEEKDKLLQAEEEQNTAYKNYMTQADELNKIIEDLNKRKKVLTMDKEQIDEALLAADQIQFVDDGAQTDANNDYIEGLVERHENALGDCEKLEEEISRLKKEYEERLRKAEKQATALEDELFFKNEQMQNHDEKLRTLEDERDALIADLRNNGSESQNRIKALKAEHDEKIATIKGELDAAYNQIEDLKIDSDNNLGNKAQQIDELKHRIEELIKENKRISLEGEEKVDYKDFEIKELHIQFNRLSEDFKLLEESAGTQLGERDAHIRMLEDQLNIQHAEKDHILRNYQGTLDDKEAEINELELKLQKVLETQDELHETFKEELEEKEEQMNHLREKLNMIVAENERLAFANTVNSQKNEQLKELQDHIKMLKSEKLSLEDNFENLQAGNARVIEELNSQWQLRLDERAREHDTKMQKLKNEKMELEAELSERKKKHLTELEDLGNQLSEVRAERRSTMHAFETNYKGKIYEMDALNEELARSKTRLDLAISDARNQKDHFEDIIADLNTRLAVLQEQVKVKENYISKLEARVRELNEGIQDVMTKSELSKEANAVQLAELNNSYVELSQNYANHIKNMDEQMGIKRAQMQDLEANIKELTDRLNRSKVPVKMQTDVSGADIEELKGVIAGYLDTHNKTVDKFNDDLDKKDAQINSLGDALSALQAANNQLAREHNGKIQALHSHIAEIEQKLRRTGLEKDEILKNSKEQLEFKDADISDLEEKLKVLLAERVKLANEANNRIDEANSYIEQLEQKVQELLALTDKQYEDGTCQTSIRNISPPKVLISTPLQTNLSTVRNNGFGGGIGIDPMYSYQLNEGSSLGGHGDVSTQCDFKVFTDAKVQTEKRLTVIEVEIEPEDKLANPKNDEIYSMVGPLPKPRSLVKAQGGQGLLMKKTDKNSGLNETKNGLEEEELSKHKTFTLYNENKRLSMLAEPRNAIEEPKDLNVDIFYNGVKITNDQYENIKMYGRSNFDANSLTPNVPLSNRAQGDTSIISYNVSQPGSLGRSVDLINRSPVPSQVNSQYDVQRNIMINSIFVEPFKLADNVNSNALNGLSVSINNTNGQIGDNMKGPRINYSSLKREYNQEVNRMPVNVRNYSNIREPKVTQLPLRTTNDSQGSTVKTEARSMIFPYTTVKDSSSTVAKETIKQNIMQPNDPMFKDMYLVKVENGQYVYRYKTNIDKKS